MIKKPLEWIPAAVWGGERGGGLVVTVPRPEPLHGVAPANVTVSPKHHRFQIVTAPRLPVSVQLQDDEAEVIELDRQPASNGPTQRVPG